jgi:hypothetical protein
MPYQGCAPVCPAWGSKQYVGSTGRKPRAQQLGEFAASASTRSCSSLLSREERARSASIRRMQNPHIYRYYYYAPPPTPPSSLGGRRVTGMAVTESKPVSVSLHTNRSCLTANRVFRTACCPHWKVRVSHLKDGRTHSKSDYEHWKVRYRDWICWISTDSGSLFSQ